MTARSLNLILAAAAIACLLLLQHSSDRLSEHAKLLDLRVSALERHIAAIHASAQHTSQRLQDLTAALPDNRWSLEPGIPGMSVQVPVYITRPDPRP